MTDCKQILFFQVFEEYAELFKEFLYPITPEEPYINIVMVGETGAGKSSFINTFATALANKKYLKDTYRISPKQTKDKEKSATKRVKSYTLYICDLSWNNKTFRWIIYDTYLLGYHWLTAFTYKLCTFCLSIFHIGPLSPYLELTD